MKAPKDNCNREKINIRHWQIVSRVKINKRRKDKPIGMGHDKTALPLFPEYFNWKQTWWRTKEAKYLIIYKVVLFHLKKKYNLNALYALLEWRVNHSLFHRESLNQLLFKPDFKLWYPGLSDVRNIYKKQKHFVEKSYQDEHAGALLNSNNENAIVNDKFLLGLNWRAWKIICVLEISTSLPQAWI